VGRGTTSADDLRAWRLRTEPASSTAVGWIEELRRLPKRAWPGYLWYAAVLSEEELRLQDPSLPEGRAAVWGARGKRLRRGLAAMPSAVRSVRRSRRADPALGSAPAAAASRRVVVVQELMPGYRVPFFEALRARLVDHDVQLTVVHGFARGGRASRADGGALPWAVTVDNRHVRLVPGMQAAVWEPVPRAVLRNADVVVAEQANRQLFTYVLLARYVVAGRPRLVLWGHGASLQAEGRLARTAEHLKAAVSRRAHWWLAYTEGSADRVAALGFPRERITVVQNAVAIPPPSAAVDRVAGQCLYIGSLYRYKRIAYLLEAGRRAALLRPDFRLVVVGDGEDRVLIEEAAGSAPWLDYRGPLVGQAASDVLRQSTLLLMPGRVGLSVVDSFVAECPLVTVDSDLHSPEIEYLQDGVNGVCLPAGTGPAAYAEALAELLDDPAGLEVLREGCREAAATYTLDAMVERYADGLLRALE
jgi:hypothetical protein